MSGQIYNDKDTLKTILIRHLRNWEQEYGVTEDEKFTVADRFAILIKTAYEKTGLRCVVLIDEYDKPLVDNIENEELMDSYRVI